MRLNFKLRYSLLLLGLISGYFFLARFYGCIKGFPFCVFKAITGIPCPACGSTRATVLLLHGQWKDAFEMNALAFLTNLFILTGMVWMIRDLIKGKETFIPALKRDWNPKVKWLVFVLIGLNWIWVIYQGR